MATSSQARSVYAADGRGACRANAMTGAGSRQDQDENLPDGSGNLAMTWAGPLAPTGLTDCVPASTPTGEGTGRALHGRTGHASDVSRIRRGARNRCLKPAIVPETDEGRGMSRDPAHVGMENPLRQPGFMLSWGAPQTRRPPALQHHAAVLCRQGKDISNVMDSRFHTF